MRCTWIAVLSGCLSGLITVVLLSFHQLGRAIHSRDLWQYTMMLGSRGGVLKGSGESHWCGEAASAQKTFMQTPSILAAALATDNCASAIHLSAGLLCEPDQVWTRRAALALTARARSRALFRSQAIKDWARFHTYPEQRRAGFVGAYLEGVLKPSISCGMMFRFGTKANTPSSPSASWNLCDPHRVALAKGPQNVVALAIAPKSGLVTAFMLDWLKFIPEVMLYLTSSDAQQRSETNSLKKKMDPLLQNSLELIPESLIWSSDSLTQVETYVETKRGMPASAVGVKLQIILVDCEGCEHAVVKRAVESLDSLRQVVVRFRIRMNAKDYSSSLSSINDTLSLLWEDGFHVFHSQTSTLSGKLLLLDVGLVWLQPDLGMIDEQSSRLLERALPTAQTSGTASRASLSSSMLKAKRSLSCFVRNPAPEPKLSHAELIAPVYTCELRVHAVGDPRHQEHTLCVVPGVVEPAHCDVFSDSPLARGRGAASAVACARAAQMRATNVGVYPASDADANAGAGADASERGADSTAGSTAAIFDSRMGISLTLVSRVVRMRLSDDESAQPRPRYSQLSLVLEDGLSFRPLVDLLAHLDYILAHKQRAPNRWNAYVLNYVHRSAL